MRYGIFADVHSNLEALTVVLDYYRKQQIDKFVFLGDVVGYGADPQEACSLVKDLGAVCVAGNHDWAAAGKFDIEYFSVYAKEALIWTKRRLGQEQRRWLKSFPLTYKEGGFICVHGSVCDPGQFHYITDRDQAALNFPRFKEKICFIGHSHQCEVFCRRDNEVTCRREEKVLLTPESRYIINVGSVGQPRDGDPRACLCIYDSRKDLVFFPRLAYDVGAAAEKIKKAGLPLRLARRLYGGY